MIKVSYHLDDIVPHLFNSSGETLKDWVILHLLVLIEIIVYGENYCPISFMISSVIMR